MLSLPSWGLANYGPWAKYVLLLLVYSDCYDKWTVDWVASTKKHVIFTVLEAGKSRRKVLADLLSSERLLPGLQIVVLHPLGEGSKLCSLHPFIRLRPHDVVGSQGPHSWMPSHQGFSLQHRKVGETWILSPEQPPIFVSMVLLEHSHAYSFICCL